MEQTNTPQQPSRKKAILSLLVLLALTCVVVFIFSSHWAEISTALAQLSFWQVLLVLAIGLTYPLLEGIVCWLIIRCRLPGFTLRHGLDAAFVGIFGNVVGLGAGAVPMESYYLYHCGLSLGPGVGLMTLQYVFHKTTVLLYATVMLLLQHRWLAANTSGVMHYLPAAYCVVALVIVALVLLCVSPLVQRLARWAMGFLHKTAWPWPGPPKMGSHQGHFCAPSLGRLTRRAFLCTLGAGRSLCRPMRPARKLGTCSFLRKNEHVPNLRAGRMGRQRLRPAPSVHRKALRVSLPREGAQKWPWCEPIFGGPGQGQAVLCRKPMAQRASRCTSGETQSSTSATMTSATTQ